MSTATRLTGLMIAVLCAGSAAVTRGGPLPTDPNAMGGVNQGTQFFQNIGGLTTLSADVEYAVYAPGQFTKTFGAGSDPSGGTQYVYAYEAFNLNDPPNPRSLGILTVGLGPNAQASNIEALPVAFGNFGLLPVTSSFGGTPATSARWDYTGHTVPVGQNTQILLFTSPHPPTPVVSSVVGGGLGASNNLPSPIPEPASWTLLILGSVALAFRRVMARRRVA